MAAIYVATGTHNDSRRQFDALAMGDPALDECPMGEVVMAVSLTERCERRS
jgi:hypothetical protein